MLIAQADEHFNRLRAYGFNVVTFSYSHAWLGFEDDAGVPCAGCTWGDWGGWRGSLRAR